MFRARRGLGRSGDLPRKLAGIVLAVAGIAVIADKVPFVVWWTVLGIGLVVLGWKLFTG